MKLGLAILSAIVVFFFVKPLTTDGMIQEDQDVSLFLSLSRWHARPIYNIFPVSSLLGRTWLWHVRYGFWGQCYVVGRGDEKWYTTGLDFDEVFFHYYYIVFFVHVQCQCMCRLGYISHTPIVYKGKSEIVSQYDKLKRVTDYIFR